MIVDSSDSEERDKSPQNTMYRNESSGAFEIIDYGPESTVLHVSTIHENIILNEKLKPYKMLPIDKWKELIRMNSMSHNINNYVNLLYSICDGLKPDMKTYFWETLCERNNNPPILKQSNSLNQKYNKVIKQSIQKLRDRMLPLQFGPQLEQFLSMSRQLLENYYIEDPEVGFSKSMEYLAFGVLVSLCQNAENRASLLPNAGVYFASIMRKKKLRDIYFPGFPGLFTKIKQLQQQVKQQLPEVHSHINKLGKEWQHLFFKHYLTLFLHKIPYKCLIPKLIQTLVFQGSVIVTHIIKRILSQTKTQILKIKKQSLQDHLKDNLFFNYVSKFKKYEMTECVYNLLIRVEGLGK